MRAPNKTLIVICLLIIWWGASWLIEDAQYRDRTGSMIEQAEKHANTQALDLADSLYKKLDYISNTPKFLSNLLRVRRAVQRFQFSKANSSYEVSKKTWTDDPDLNNLSQLLATAENDFNADSIFILNIAGDCIAASNWNKAGSPIRTNLADREYFSENQAGIDAVQYAVG